MTGYAEFLPVYQSMGWKGVLAFKHATKFPPPDGFTGKTGRWPTEIDYAVWREQFRDGNLGLRLGQEVEVGGRALHRHRHRRGPLRRQDRSADDRRGREALGAIAARSLLHQPNRRFAHPALPHPGGTKLHGVLKFRELNLGDVELIQFHHRYMVCSPSIHDKTGMRYQWFDADGNVMDAPPRVEDLAVLPDPWVEGLRVDAPRSNSKPG